MVFKELIMVLTPDADPERHRVLVKTERAEEILVLVPQGDYETAVKIAKDMVSSNGVNSIMLCPGFSHEGVAKIANAVRGLAGVSVARDDPESQAVMFPILKKEGYIQEDKN